MLCDASLAPSPLFTHVNNMLYYIYVGSLHDKLEPGFQYAYTKKLYIFAI